MTETLLKNSIPSVLTNYGFFYQLYNSLPTQYTWLNSVDSATDLDYIYYLNHSGEKLISPLNAELLSYLVVNTDYSQYWSKIIKIIQTKFSYKWNKVYEALITSYNPINNINMEENENIEESKNETENIGTNIETVNTNTDNIFAYNGGSVNATPSNETVNQNTVNANKNENERENVKENTLTKSKTKEGKDTYKSYQELIKEELDLRKNEFLEIVFKDLDTIFTLNVY